MSVPRSISSRDSAATRDGCVTLPAHRRQRVHRTDRARTPSPASDVASKAARPPSSQIRKPPARAAAARCAAPAPANPASRFGENASDARAASRDRRRSRRASGPALRHRRDLGQDVLAQVHAQTCTLAVSLPPAARECFARRDRAADALQRRCSSAMSSAKNAAKLGSRPRSSALVGTLHGGRRRRRRGAASRDRRALGPGRAALHAERDRPYERRSGCVVRERRRGSRLEVVRIRVSNDRHGRAPSRTVRRVAGATILPHEMRPPRAKENAMVILVSPSGQLGMRAPALRPSRRRWRRHTLASVRGANGVVVMFICNHCPYVKAVHRQDRPRHEGARAARRRRDRDLDATTRRPIRTTRSTT